jgi:hypothetical protein
LPASKVQKDQIRSLMEDYAGHGVFRGISRRPARNGVTVFRLVWFRERVFDVLVNIPADTVGIPVVLPRVPEFLYRDLKTFIQSHHSADLPDHRRIDKTKVRLKCARTRGDVSLTLAVKDGDFDYALRRLIHLVHEIYVLFLSNAMYSDYVIAELGADPEWQ